MVSTIFPRYFISDHGLVIDVGKVPGPHLCPPLYRMNTAHLNNQALMGRHQLLWKYIQLDMINLRGNPCLHDVLQRA